MYGKSPLPVKGCKFDRCSALMSIEQWGFFNVPHPLRQGSTVYNGHLWHSHLLPSVWQLSYHYLFLRLRSVATGDRTLISRIRGKRSTSTLPRQWLHWICTNSIKMQNANFTLKSFRVMDCLGCKHTPNSFQFILSEWYFNTTHK